MSGGWLIRAASAPRWGGGHVTRCRALALALRAHGPVAFLLDADDGGWRARLEAEGFVVAREAPRARLSGCVLDHYDLPAAERAALRARADALAALYDGGGAPPDGADLLIASGLEPGRTSVAGVPALCGPAYALLDPRFRRAPTRAAGETVARVVLAFGLRDSGNATSVAIEAARRAGLDAELVATLGAGAPHRAEAERRLAAFGRGRLAVDEPDMPGLLASADLVLGAGGVGLFERMALGVPSITLICADNQRAGAEAAAQAGATLLLGRADEVDAGAFAEALRALAADPAARARQSAQGRALVDGRGAERAAQALAALTERRATQAAAMSR